MDTKSSSRRELFILVFGSSDFFPETVINGVPAAEFLRSTVINFIRRNLSVYSPSIIAEAFEVQDAHHCPLREINSEYRTFLQHSLSQVAHKTWNKRK